MFRNYLKIALRNLFRNKLNTGINIVSLAIGLSASFVIGLMVYYDLTFDTYHPDSDRVYRVTSLFSNPQGEFANSGVPIPLAGAARDEMTGLETVAAFYSIDLIEAENPESGKTFKRITPNWLGGYYKIVEIPFLVLW